MKKLVFATANPNKIREIQQMFGDKYNFLSLEDIGCEEDVPETQDTIEGNALQKAWYVYEKYGANCFAEDTGLEIEALYGAPGVYSARYAGPQRNSEDNIDRVLKEMADSENRKAQFKTVIALIIDGVAHCFEGIVEGQILRERRGTKGFGYDPIFVPIETNKTFAEMDGEEKGKISHRGRATVKLQEYLNNLKI